MGSRDDITQLEATVRELTSELTDAVMAGHKLEAELKDSGAKFMDAVSTAVDFGEAIDKLEADKRVLVEALEEISNDWVEVNRVGMSHIAAKALAQVKGDK